MVSVPTLIKMVADCETKNGSVCKLRMYGDASGDMLDGGGDVLFEFDDIEDLEQQIKEYLKNG
jgi:hypothetical protein